MINGRETADVSEPLTKPLDIFDFVHPIIIKESELFHPFHSPLLLCEIIHGPADFAVLWRQRF